MDILEIFQDSQKARAYGAGEQVFRRGDASAEEMYVVLSGRVDILAGGQLIESLQPGSVFGEMALVDDQPRSADAVAAVDSRLEPIDKEWFRYLVRRSPDFALHVMAVMAKRLRRFMEGSA